jgi:excisionase family DNA binding protein
MENLFTTASAAQILGVSQPRIRQLIKDGRIPAEKRGRDLLITQAALDRFISHGRKNVGRPSEKNNQPPSAKKREPEHRHHLSPLHIGKGKIFTGDALNILPDLPADFYQMIIADPPYFQVLLDEQWDNNWSSAEEYLIWTRQWALHCQRALKPDGLMYIFGQLGKREHVWLHTCSMLAQEMQFHDMIIWDRAVGYNERYDSFTPQYEMILVLRKNLHAKPYFDKDAVRLPYEEGKIQSYLRDKRYKDREAREKHLRKGKYATNILRIPSLKGSSKEKIGHPSQKPIALINQLISSSTRKNDVILDPFLGSGTTAEVAESLGRQWVGIESNPDYVKMSQQRLVKLLATPELNFC